MLTHNQLDMKTITAYVTVSRSLFINKVNYEYFAYKKLLI